MRLPYIKWGVGQKDRGDKSLLRLIGDYRKGYKRSSLKVFVKVSSASQQNSVI